MKKASKLFILFFCFCFLHLFTDFFKTDTAHTEPWTVDSDTRMNDSDFVHHHMNTRKGGKVVIQGK